MVRFNEGNYSGAIYYYYERVKEFWEGTVSETRIQLILFNI